MKEPNAGDLIQVTDTLVLYKSYKERMFHTPYLVDADEIFLVLELVTADYGRCISVLHRDTKYFLYLETNMKNLKIL